MTIGLVEAIEPLGVIEPGATITGGKTTEVPSNGEHRTAFDLSQPIRPAAGLVP